MGVLGNWIPATISGVGQALCSNIRMVYLAIQVMRNAKLQQADVIVIDGLPSPIPFLLSSRLSILFYCHFPDKLLVRNKSSRLGQVIYRRLVETIEDWTMPLADMFVVNSMFTMATVKSVFPSLAARDMQVLYPTLDTDSNPLRNPSDQSDTSDANDGTTRIPRIVSLNRYERKKNIELLIYAYAELLANGFSSEVEIVIAGGYDTYVVENVEYRAELQNLTNKLKLPNVKFLTSVSDQERSNLLKSACCVIYTPSEEHFGIVPLEAMYAGTCVIAVNSGGPKETIVHGETGFLCDPTPKAFGLAIQNLLENPQKAQKMGRAGKLHVCKTFGKERLKKEWKKIIQETIQLRRQRNLKYSTWKSLIYLIEALFVLIFSIFLTWTFRQLGWIGPTESLWGAARRSISGDEL